MTTVKIETTNNPKIIKFVFNKMLTEGAFEYNAIDEAQNSPLVQQLFKLPFVKRVFVSANFIALEKYDMLEWADVQNDLAEILQAYFDQGKELFQENKKQVVEVYAEETPNPLTQKFVTNRLLHASDIEILNAEEAVEVPLARALYEFPFVKEIFISQNYISVTKDKSVDWFEVNSELRQFIKQYVEDQKEITTTAFMPKEKINQTNTGTTAVYDDEISNQIISILDEYIRPAVASDGGNIQFQSYDAENKIVNVILQGACNGCPSSTYTLKNGIEATLKQFLPGKIEGVNALN
jgi:Fe-S cluster biogenesis protein NfuA